jgi:NADPH:quinone reductase-like Zn-dependent oxidoreductase
MVTPRFRAPDLFEERDAEMPRPGPGEVLVRVVAPGTNPIDAKLRATGGSRGLEAPIILGADVSGVVEEVGPGSRTQVRMYLPPGTSMVCEAAAQTPSTGAATSSRGYSTVKGGHHPGQRCEQRHLH